MRLEVMDGVIRHRLLLNWAADPEVVQPLLPTPFRPQLARGRAVVGICALRLEELRPRHLPAWTGVGTDNAAHRIAVEWDDDDGVRSGVYVLRRDSGQRLSTLVGGRLFPGVHGRARFTTVDEPDGGLRVRYEAPDGLRVDAEARRNPDWRSALFATPQEASEFFAAGSCGWSPDRRHGLEGVELITPPWTVDPVSATVSATFYDDPVRFPPGSIAPDAALLLRDLPVRWRRIPAPTARRPVPA